jgi:hypothetical protein
MNRATTYITNKLHGVQYILRILYLLSILINSLPHMQAESSLLCSQSLPQDSFEPDEYIHKLECRKVNVKKYIKEVKKLKYFLC